MRIFTGIARFFFQTESMAGSVEPATTRKSHLDLTTANACIAVRSTKNEPMRRQA